jgi:NADPH:quinone reductase-like Zn-dependent oxidoreductase
MPSNTAAWLTGKGEPLSINESPYLEPKPNQILIECRAVAINPVDWALQLMGQDLFDWLKYPYLMGEDVAGEIVAVGSEVKRAKVGDRVLGLANGTGKDNGVAAFQEYTLLANNLFSKIPDSMSFEEASVVPLGLSTAASGMFEKEYLALPFPTVDPKPTGKTLLVWSGSSSVGANAIQLGVAAGCEVITTCSPKNFGFVKKLGAVEAWDYSSETIVSDILNYLEGKTIAGAVGSMFYPSSYELELFHGTSRSRDMKSN